MSTDKDQPTENTATSSPRPMWTKSVGNYSDFIRVSEIAISAKRFRHMQRASRFLNAEKRRR